MKIKNILIAGLAICTFSTLASETIPEPTGNDITGEIGKLIVVQMISLSADTSASRFSIIHIETDYGVEEYFQGGLRCGIKQLSESQMEILTRHLGTKMRVQAISKAGQGVNARCIVGFNLIASK